jgi:MoaA/NifB/PqqE/SkfB family radical SAM enzyme
MVRANINAVEEVVTKAAEAGVDALEVVHVKETPSQSRLVGDNEQ